MSQPDWMPLLAFAGAPVAAYVAVRVGLATVTTMLGTVVTRLDRMEQSRDTHTGELGALRAKDAAQDVELANLKNEIARLWAKLSGQHRLGLPPRDGE